MPDITPCNQLIIAHMAFARRIAKESFFRCGKHVPLEELESYAYLGLTQSARRYNATCGVSFAAYSCRRIKGAVMDGVRSYNEYKTCSFSVMDEGYTSCESYSENGKNEGLEISKVDSAYIKLEGMEAIEVALRSLSDREQKIIRSVCLGEKSLKTVAIEHKITQGRVSQICSKFKKSLADLGIRDE